MIERLTALGFTSQEARVYLALLQQPLATGYELAKSAGLQRANVYQVLAALSDAGVAVRASDENPARYVASPPADVFGRIKRQTSERADSLIADLAALSPAQEQAAFTLRDREAVIDRTASLVSEARSRVEIGAHV